MKIAFEYTKIKDIVLMIKLREIERKKKLFSFGHLVHPLIFVASKLVHKINDFSFVRKKKVFRALNVLFVSF